MAIKNDVSSPLVTKKSGYSPKQERVEYLPKIQNIELKLISDLTLTKYPLSYPTRHSEYKSLHEH